MIKHIVNTDDEMSIRKVINIFLKKDGYNSVIEKKTKISGTDTQIKYNKEDYYTAYKIAKKLGINKMIERDELKNKVIVIANLFNVYPIIIDPNKICPKEYSLKESIKI